MRVLKAKYILTCNDYNTILEDGAIFFDEFIKDIDTLENIKAKYPNVQIEDCGENSCILPGLVNSHLHLEFSSNKSMLKYGNFLEWLHSVMKYRDDIINSSTNELIEKELKKILKSGVTTIGAISSYGFDFLPCVNSPQRVVYFNEAIGSKQDMIDTLFSDFKARLHTSQKYKSDTFIPAIAIHSAYSVHPFLLREILKIAKEENLRVSAHFMESKEEKEWLENNSGAFLDFFMKLLGQNKAVSSPMEFLNAFKGIENLSFTHCVEINDDELETIKKLKATINHCPTSNRLLNNSKLDIEKIMNKKIDFSIGTDGLSSNNSLSIFDELRSALYIHETQNCPNFAKTLLNSSTKGGAKALGLNVGSLQRDALSDMIVLNLPQQVENIEDLELQIILHTKYPKEVIIGGKSV